MTRLGIQMLDPRFSVFAFYPWRPAFGLVVPLNFIYAALEGES